MEGLELWLHALHFIAAGLQGAVEDVVDVGGDDQAVDGSAHALGDVARKDVAEIAGGNAEAHLAVRRAQRQRRMTRSRRPGP